MDRPLRIAFLSEHASPAALLGSVDAGGQNVYVDEVSRGVARLGCSVDVFTRRDCPDVPEVQQLAPGVRIVNVLAGPETFVPKDELWPHMPAFCDSILSYAARNGQRYDLIHSNFWMSGWVATQLRRTLDIPVVQIFHAMGKTKQRHQGAADTSPDGRIAVEIDVIRQVDRLIAQCPSERSELLDDYGADPPKVAVIPSAVNTRLFHPVARDAARRQIRLDTDGPVVVYAGRMLPRKDVRNVVRAVALLARHDKPQSVDALAPITLLLVGGETEEPNPNITPEIGELQRLAAELGISARVRFVGKRQPCELCNYYSAGDVVVTTPWYEPFGLTPLEGQACGRPVVGSAIGGLTYTIQHGVTGYLVPPRDPEALAERLFQLLTQPAVRERMGQAARRRVERDFTWSTVAERTLALYRDVLTLQRPSFQDRSVEPEPNPTAQPEGASVGV